MIIQICLHTHSTDSIGEVQLQVNNIFHMFSLENSAWLWTSEIENYLALVPYLIGTHTRFLSERSERLFLREIDIKIFHQHHFLFIELFFRLVFLAVCGNVRRKHQATNDWSGRSCLRLICDCDSIIVQLDIHSLLSYSSSIAFFLEISFSLIPLHECFSSALFLISFMK